MLPFPPIYIWPTAKCDTHLNVHMIWFLADLQLLIMYKNARNVFVYSKIDSVFDTKT